MSKTGSASGSFFGNFIYDQLLRRRPHFLFDLSRAVDFSFVKTALKDFYVTPIYWAWGSLPVCILGYLDRDGPGSPGESAPRSSASSPSVSSFTACTGPATGAWPK